MKLPIIIIGAVIIAVVAAGAGFFGGMTYAQTQAQNTAANFIQQRAIQNAQGGSAPGGNAQNVATDACGFPIRNVQNAQNNPQNAQGNFGGRQFGGQFGGAFGGLNPAQLGNCVARGQIKAVNGDTLEISTADKVVLVKVNDRTLISKTDKGALSDLQPGDRVTVFSQETGDSPTASTIQLQRPITQPQQ
jgi:hypothetical protein